MIAVVDRDLVPRIEDVIDLRVDLLVVGVDSWFQSAYSGRPFRARQTPLMDGRIQTIAAIENIGVRHGAQISLADSGRIHSGR